VQQLTLMSNKAGFTLVELLVSLVITLVGLLALLASINLALFQNLGNEQRLQAIGVAEDVLNDVKRQPFTNISTSWTKATGTEPLQEYYLRGLKKKYTVVRSITDYTDTKRVTVGVSWTYRGQNLEHTVSTIIGKNYGE